MNIGRHYASLCLVGNFIYAIAGSNEDNQPISSIERLKISAVSNSSDPSVWYLLEPIYAKPRTNQICFSHAPDRLVVWGGLKDGNYELDTTSNHCIRELGPTMEGEFLNKECEYARQPPIKGPNDTLWILSNTDTDLTPRILYWKKGEV